MMISVPKLKTFFKWFLHVEDDESYTGICYSIIERNSGLLRDNGMDFVLNYVSLKC